MNNNYNDIETMKGFAETAQGIYLAAIAKGSEEVKNELDGFIKTADDAAKNDKRIVMPIDVEDWHEAFNKEDAEKTLEAIGQATRLLYKKYFYENLLRLLNEAE